MTLPEHAVCSLMIAQLGVGPQLGRRGVVLVTLAGVAPDLDVVSRLFGDQYFWSLHHALGHSLLSIVLMSFVISLGGRFLCHVQPGPTLFAWCLVSAAAHCATDALYWWGIQPLWPWSSFKVELQVLEYLDLIVLSIWLAGVTALYRWRASATGVARMTLATFSVYVVGRCLLPAPTGWLALLTGGWMYSAPQGTPVLDWW